jgi:cytidylate kinase
MMPVDPIQIVHALVGAELTPKKSDRYIPQGNVVTVSREYCGGGGEVLARQLAERLGVPYYDKQLLDAIIEAAPDNKTLMERLDNQVSTAREEIMHMIVTGHSLAEEYRRHLVNVVLNIARKSGVILGRGAHLLLANHRVFRVRVVGSPDVCATRLAKEENIAVEEAARRAHHVNEERTEFIRKVFNRHINDPVAFDLTINTDHIDLESATNIVLFAMQQTGYTLPRQALKTV